MVTLLWGLGEFNALFKKERKGKKRKTRERKKKRKERKPKQHLKKS
jgi:hypothetical protein